MVTTPMIAPSIREMPVLPKHLPSEFQGATEVSVRTNKDATQDLNVLRQSDISAFGMACDVDVDVASDQAAMINLEIFAPCKPHAVVHVSHGGLSFEARVSITGRATVSFPAMQQEADVFVAVEEEIFEHRIEVPGAKNYARVVLVGLTQDAPKLIASNFSDQMVVYQNQNIQIFSVDLRDVDHWSTYRLTLRHQVTEQNCNHPVNAHLRRILPGMSDENQILQFDGQDCSRVGAILELKNIVQDLKLASK